VVGEEVLVLAMVKMAELDLQILFLHLFLQLLVLLAAGAEQVVGLVEQLLAQQTHLLKHHLVICYLVEVELEAMVPFKEEEVVEALEAQGQPLLVRLVVLVEVDLV
jgi:hypothetical protein